MEVILVVLELLVYLKRPALYVRRALITPVSASTHSDDLLVAFHGHGQVACSTVGVSFLDQIPAALHVLQVGPR